VGVFNFIIMKNIKITLLFSLVLLASNFLRAQQGLEGLVIEKYYQANAADVANATANGASPALTTNTIVYRVYVDMLPGYKFVQLYGTPAHPMKVETTTNFYNDPNYSVALNPGTISTINIAKHTAMLDSWFTTGGVASGKVGVMKLDDTDGALTNTQGILLNNPSNGCYGAPLQGTGSKDGFMPTTTGSYLAPTTVGLGGTSNPLLNALFESTGSSIIINNGAIAALGGIVGPTAANRVLVGQFSTDGILSLNFNVQIVNASNVPQNYVYSNATGSEIANSSLSFTQNVASLTNSNASSCFGAGSVLSSATASNYYWYLNGTQVAGATSQTLSPASAGTYSLVTANAAGLCSNVSPTYTFTTASPTVTASAASATICSGSSVVLTATGASTYTWNNGSTGSSITVSPTAATPYTVTWASAAGCTGTATVNVGVISAPVITSPTTVSCSGAAVVLTSSLTSGVQWYKTGVLINGATAATYSATSAGTYTVKPTACSSLVSNGIAIVAGTTPTGSATASVQSGNLLLCGSPSQVVLVSNTGITANTGLQWYVNGSAIAGATALTYTATTAGSYDVRRVQLATGCTGIASTPLTVVVGTVPSTPVASVQTGSTLALCSGGTSTFFSNVPPSGSVSLQWFKDGVAQSGATAATFLAGAVGSYTVKATHTSGCASALSNALVLTAVPTAAISSPSLSICDGTAITLTSNVTSNIQWYRGTTLLSGATASTYSATIAGTYTVKSTLCSSQVSNGLVVITGTGPGAPIASTANALVCSGSSVTLNSSVGTTAGASLQWYKDGAAISGATAQAYVTAVAGSYTVRRIAIPSGCLGAASIPVTVINGGSTPSGVANALVAGGGMPLICSSTTNNIVLVSSVAPTASTGLQWYKGTTSTNGTIINGATALTYTATEPGFYSVRRVTPTGCYGAPGAVLSITNGTIPPNTAVVTAINGGGTVVCGTTAVKLQSSVAPTQNATLQWYKDGSPVVNATTQTLSVLSAGSYAVRRITTSCPSLPSNAISVTVGVVPSAPVVSVQSGSLATCPGVSVVLSSSAPVAGTTLQWFSTNNPISNATSETYSTATAGLYRVKATNGICLSPFSNSLTLSVDPVGAASVSIFSGSLTLCNASTVTFKSAHSPTSSTGIRWFKDGVEIAGAIGQFYTASTAGIYTARRINITTGCLGTASSPFTAISCNPIVVNDNNEEQEDATSKLNEELTWDAAVSRNPYDQYVTIRLNTSSDSDVELTMVDAMGKVVSTDNASMKELGSMHIGEGLTPGMYLIQVRQDENIKTIRVIKQ
jgi:hypothetical protein